MESTLAEGDGFRPVLLDMCMLMALSLRFFALLLLLCNCAFAGEAPGPQEVAQNFYDAYMKTLRSSGDVAAAIADSDALTRSFKKTYAKMAEDGLDSDPVICAQDYPDAGFEAGAAKITGSKAKVVLSSRDPDFKHTFTVFLVKSDDHWLIAGTSELKPAK
jgi:hypothetical protein